MNYLSVCSGIEAATQAWHPLGWKPVAFSEIDKFPSAVLEHRYPDVPNWGDMTKYQEWPDAEIDLLVGGTPCQSFSVAGLRRGLADPRGNLALTYLGIADRYRPRWILWENVPGVLSSGRGRDFGAFLGALGNLGYGWAYRVLDAQFVRTRRFSGAVPQRRRRVFVVGYIGDWRRAAAVLFDPESLLGNPAPRREAGQAASGRTGISTAVSSGHGWWDTSEVGATVRAQDSITKADTLVASTGNVAHCLNAGGMGRQDYETETMDAHSLRGEGFDASEDGTGRGTPLVPVAFDCKGTEVQYTTDGSHPTLRSMGHNHSHQNAGGHAAVAWALGSHAGAADGYQTNRRHDAGGPVGLGVQEGCAYSLRAGRTQSVGTPWAVRRLTPVECERLQGFPDGFTAIPWRGKPADQCPDGPRYKALGNSMAVNCMEWLGERIALVDSMEFSDRLLKDWLTAA